MNQRPSLTELTAFAAIVRHASFRAAADELGMSASTLSHMMRALEQRLALRLFHRTTRSVAPTEAGARFFRNLSPILAELDQALADVGTLSEQPTGSVRINAAEPAARILMERIVPTFLQRYPGIHVDLVVEGRLVDIVAEGFDAGVRLGESLPRDMVAVPFGGDGRLVCVAAPAYLRRAGTPRTPDELARHPCIRFRLPSGKMYRWEFKRHGQELKFDADGPITLDSMDLMVSAAIKGLGVAFVWEDTARPAIDSGQLATLLDDWTPPFDGHYLYYPSHRLVPAGLRAFVDVIKDVERDARPTAAPRPGASAADRPPGRPGG
ncbi:LysR family transcriptional regulator [Bordetella genomosp. 8]|uniref:LysR family transcriptional regulator n=1 Tax=Bordetella genomosp. 8 TaxID=1416806 RepID=A0A1W6YP94_9BORD|nr:LysR family transcriptional regulator [Bordetella genomosp. 8]ARP82831.1 LysR family transcriptional regulator [Bordetella genomosp. 8]